MGTRNRDFVFLGLALAFLLTSILMVRHQSAPRTREAQQVARGRARRGVASRPRGRRNAVGKDRGGVFNRALAQPLLYASGPAQVGRDSTGGGRPGLHAAAPDPNAHGLHAARVGAGGRGPDYLQRRSASAPRPDLLVRAGPNGTGAHRNNRRDGGTSDGHYSRWHPAVLCQTRGQDRRAIHRGICEQPVRSAKRHAR